MGKSRKNDIYADYEDAERAFSAMDRRERRKQKGRQRDPEAIVEPVPGHHPLFPAYRN